VFEGLNKNLHNLRYILKWIFGGVFWWQDGGD
jgi:hypothetical protein